MEKLTKEAEKILMERFGKDSIIACVGGQRDTQ